MIEFLLPFGLGVRLRQQQRQPDGVTHSSVYDGTPGCDKPLQLSGVVGLILFRNVLSRVIGGLLVLLWLTGCSPNYPPNDRPTLYATISSDGQIVATLANIGTDKARLRVIRLNDDKGWLELKAPPYTTSIQFRMQGHELLLTHHIGEGEVSDLSKWDMDDLAAGVQRIYQSNGLVFPIEVSTGQYLVRTCPLTSEQKCHPWFNVWQLVENDKLLRAFTEERRLNYSWPNVMQGQGFYWMKVVGEYAHDEPFPSFRSVAFSDGKSPIFNLAELGQDTTDIRCDYQANRCLRSYIKNWGNKKPEPYLYAAEVLTRNKRCLISDVLGYYDEISLAPDGNAAVLSVAPAYDQPRHVMVMHFKPGQCEPTSIQHIHFNQG